jgi:hypothetical protein
MTKDRFDLPEGVTTSNEKELSDGRRERASLEMKGF